MVDWIDEIKKKIESLINFDAEGVQIFLGSSLLVKSVSIN